MPTNQSVRILVVDTRAIFRAALQKLLETEPGFRVVGEAADPATALTAARRVQPDILLVRLPLPPLVGLQALRTLYSPSAPWRIVLLTPQIDSAQRAAALQLGARAVIMKDSSAGMLIECIRTVFADQRWNNGDGAGHTAEMCPPAARSDKATALFKLTRRELQVIGAVLAGYNDNEVAQRLSISRETARHHLSNVFDKLGVSNRLELALFASHHRLGDDVPALQARFDGSSDGPVGTVRSWRRAG